MNPPGNSSPQEISLHDLQQIFLFDSYDETIEFCLHYGCKIINRNTKEIYNNNSYNNDSYYNSKSRSSSSSNNSSDGSGILNYKLTLQQLLVVLINGQNIDNLMPR